MILRDVEASEALATRCRETLASAGSSFDAARALARRMGGLVTGPGKAEFGFWAPELLEARVPDGDIFLEILQPDAQFSLTVSRQNARFRRTRLPVERADAWIWCAVDGIRAGTRDVIGDFYALTWRDGEGEWHRIFDPLAASVPFGVFAPAELYDLAAMQAARSDKPYFEGLQPGEDGAPAKLGPVVNILQIHTPTATAGRTLASLARQVEHLADRVRHGGTIEPADRLFMGYEAVQLLPVEPTTVYEAGPSFWVDDGDYGEVLTTDLRRPDTTNWGYDVVISGMAAVNPALLESGRPDELVDLIAALHTFPDGPKKVIFDVVFGHSDNQGLEALNRHYFAGPNMYGQNLSYRNWTVRAIMLEIQRRKVDFGADGVRVDGAQDFKWWDADEEVMRHDDEYLQEMADVVQEVAGTRYRPWFIFEDGRPWPQEDWELSSTYRAVIDNQRDDDVFQWGPLTFAHNTPFLYTFWLSKWWRIREMVERGSNWISGTANHDTLRRGTQINPKLNINTRLGETRMDILDHAYDNPAVQMLTYAAFPGVPMDFLNAMARASWGFIRNQDDKYGVKIMAEEAISLEWQVDDYAYSLPGAFSRLKALGYETRDDLERFLHVLPALVEVTDYDLDVIATLLNSVEPRLAGPSPFTPAALKVIARAWMDDMHDYCNVAGYLDRLTERQTAFALALREFRTARPWLRGNFAWGDQFSYVQPVDGTVLFTSFRQGPDGEQVYMVAHMEGAETEDFDPLNLHHQAADGQGGWTVALATPQIGPDYEGGPIVLRDSMGVVFTRTAPG